MRSSAPCGAFAAAVIAAGATLIPADPVETAFTYQGRLTDAGAPANGVYDLELKLYDAAIAGSQVGSTGVYGSAFASTGNTYGVFGWNESSSGTGVFGIASSSTGTTDGVQGQPVSSTGYGGYSRTAAVGSG